MLENSITKIKKSIDNLTLLEQGVELFYSKI